ncbi:hypothetical protein IR009_18805 [Pseudomonas putida]|uniref:hypothetical protein n=1 Tax=Pseudomonas putida TaxID=303 RepID=UPI0018ABF11A|nr:hypothetical protein [Pseudomonas putida]MBF8767270.1 hypothetical protein [Pseudomonas putida]
MPVLENGEVWTEGGVYGHLAGAADEKVHPYDAIFLSFAPIGCAGLDGCELAMFQVWVQPDAMRRLPLPCRYLLKPQSAVSEGGLLHFSASFCSKVGQILSNFRYNSRPSFSAGPARAVNQ